VTGESVVYSTAGTERAPDIGAAPLGYGLVWALMTWAQSLGVPQFDFGGITPEDQPEHPLARISEFKRKFRGEEVRIASDWYLDIAPAQARLLDLTGQAMSMLRGR
jgi:lipid II:glycine glycyltransferase (peptidoglycan interpeptide bridge formation enzyme)